MSRALAESPRMVARDAWDELARRGLDLGWWQDLLLQGRWDGVSLDILFLAAAIWFKGKRQRKLSRRQGTVAGFALAATSWLGESASGVLEIDG